MGRVKSGHGSKQAQRFLHRRVLKKHQKVYEEIEGAQRGLSQEGDDVQVRKDTTPGGRREGDKMKAANWLRTSERK